MPVPKSTSTTHRARLIRCAQARGLVQGSAAALSDALSLVRDGSPRPADDLTAEAISAVEAAALAAAVAREHLSRLLGRIGS